MFYSPSAICTSLITVEYLCKQLLELGTEAGEYSREESGKSLEI